MEKQKSLLHICSYSWETGGPSSFILNHAKYQISKGVKVEVASAMYPWQKKYDVTDGMMVHEFPKSVLSRFLSEFSIPMIYWFWKNRKQYDFIHVHGLWHFGSILPFIIPNKAKKIVTIHGFLDPFMLQKSKYLKKIFWFLFQKRFLAKADKLHAMNDEEYEELLRLFPQKKDQIFFLGNGIEDPLAKKEIEPNPEFKYQIEQFIGSTEIVFLFISRIAFKKGLDLLLPAFQEFSSTRSGQFKLIIAGPDDDYSKSLIDYCEAYPNPDRLVLGMVKGAEKDYLFKRCQVFVLPSYSEGFSIAALEGIAFGKICVFTYRIGFAQLVKNANAAFLIESDFHSLKAAFDFIDHSKNRLDTYAKNARNLFLENFIFEQICKKMYSNIFV